MYKNRINAYIAITILILILTIKITPKTEASQTPNIIIDAPTTPIPTGSYFTININITDVNQLAAWQLTLYYNNTILNGTITTEGTFLKQAGPTFYWQVRFTDNYNQTHGIAELTCTIIGETGGANGTGTLATITFKAKAPGKTTLHLENTKLSDPQGNPITHTTTDGNIQVEATADIAITNVTPSKAIVGQGFSIQINITIQNEGITQTFEIILYANTTKIQNETITLNQNTSITLTFQWNTTNWPKGNYILTAKVPPLPGEADTTDNTFIDGTIFIGIPGDVNADGKVDIQDIFAMALKYGAKLGESNYDPNVDANGDNKIDIADIFLAAVHYGEKDP